MDKLLVHGHSCCEVRTARSSFICDPWLYGSAYWRSWWNFPEPENIAKLIDIWKTQENVFVYISHLHWDHFHGPTIKKNSKANTSCPIFYSINTRKRIKNDLTCVLPKNREIKELKHAVKIKLNNEIEVTSFQSGLIATDSAIAIKCKILILNLNDSKIFKRSMKHLLSVIGQPSIVMRSHASANSRCCIKLSNSNTNHGKINVDKSKDDYSSEFADACFKTGAPIAIPFASNMAHLHRDTFNYNSILNSSEDVVNYFENNKLKYPGMSCLQVYPGEELDLSSLKLVKSNVNQRALYASMSKDEILTTYKDKKSQTLSKQYALEESSAINQKAICKYFISIMSETPWVVRNILKDHVCIEAVSAEGNKFFKLDFDKKEIITEPNSPLRKRYAHKSFCICFE